MHRYLRAIGFSQIKKRDELYNLLRDIIDKTLVNLDEQSEETKKTIGRDFTIDKEGTIYAEAFMEYAPGVGICVRGECSNDGVFMYDYFMPYLDGSLVSTVADVTVERHAEKESYAGVCDDIKVGVSLIFYLQDVVRYKRLEALDLLPIQGTTLTLSALSVNGTIMMPIKKDEYDKRRLKEASDERTNLIIQARQGDEDAIESLTLDDMDTYTNISRKIMKQDVYSLVDSYFMPYGVECDLYSILGEILALRYEKNRITGEELVIMTLECNEIKFDVCINKEDLYGEPAVGRRFKGVIWLQGCINYPDEGLYKPDEKNNK